MRSRNGGNVARLVLLVAIGAPLLGVLGGCLAPKRVGGPGWQAGPWPAAAEGGPVLVRVCLAEAARSAEVTSSGGLRLAAGGSAGNTALAAGQTVALRAEHGRVVWTADERTGSHDALALVPLTPDHTLTWNDRPWRGELHVSATGDRLLVVNVVELESYLAGVLPLEIGRGRRRPEFAALCAQAVAARTYAAGRLQRARSAAAARGFDVFADVRDQVYGGAAVEDTLTTAAIAATAGLVLWRGRGQLADAYFHSTCGGHTTAVHDVWPTAPDPLLRGVDDRRPGGVAWCADSRYATWSQQWSWSDLEAVLALTLPRYLDYVSQGGRAAWAADAFRPAAAGADGRRPGALRDLRVARRTAEGRVEVLAIQTDAGRYHVRGDQTRRVLQPEASGAALLRSAWFDLEVVAGQRVVAAGRGWGHGLGLCQMGALARARAGQSTAAILAHYYPGSTLAPLHAPVAVATP